MADDLEATREVPEGLADQWVLYPRNNWYIPPWLLSFLWLWLLVSVAANVQVALGSGAVRGQQAPPLLSAMNLFALLYSLEFLIARRGKLWSIEVGEQGVRLLYCGQAQWEAVWRDLRSWQPETHWNRGLGALWVVGHDGARRRLSFGLLHPNENLTKTILRSIADHASDVEALPAKTQPAPIWFVCTVVAVIAGMGYQVWTYARHH